MATAATGNGDTKTRSRLAMAIVMVSVVGIAAISIVLLFVADDTDRASQLVFSSVLPLFGTWVGTVLAFYFARENLQAATASTLALQGRSSELATPVTDVMIADSSWIAYDVPANSTVEAVPLKDLHARMGTITPPSRRLPIRDATGAVLYVIHDSTLTAYLESVGETTATMTKSFGDLLGVPDFKDFVAAIGFVGKDASVADARRVMGSIKHCNDVFVTDSGKRDERAIGWLTNTLLAGIQ
jgi:hypothetical protein